MKKYAFDSRQLEKLLDDTINLFLEYQFKMGYEEPRAREEALREIIGSLHPASETA